MGKRRLTIWTLDWTPIHAHVYGENGESGQVAQQLAKLAQQSGREQLQKLLSTMELSVKEIVWMRQSAMKMSAVPSTVWGEWEEWQACPSGCEPQQKLRTRRVLIAAFCNGNECEGHDFEEMVCSREAELAAKVANLENILEACEV